MKIEKRLEEVVWVDFGRGIPKYLLNNIYFHQERFPNLNQVLVSDNDQEPTVDSPSGLVSYVNYKHLPVSQFTKEFTRINSYREKKFKQASFWELTTKRFFFLYDYMISRNLPQALHLESDVVLLNMSRLQYVLSEAEFGLAYPLQEKDRGVASLFYVSNISTFEEFLVFVLENWKELDINDMDLLGEFSRRDDVFVPNSLPGQELIVDPGAYGPFFLGGDARNNRFPTSRRGAWSRISQDWILRLEECKIEKSDNGDVIIVDKSGFRSVLLNLHIHSKKVPYSSKELFKRLKSTRKSSCLWELGYLDRTVVLERLLSKLGRMVNGGKDVRLR